MAQNNPANDNIWTETPRAGLVEFETLRFDEIEDGDLFWLEQNNQDSNQVHRKTGDTEGMNLRTGKLHAFHPRQEVYQKT